jgi:hypothetical protein
VDLLRRQHLDFHPHPMLDFVSAQPGVSVLVVKQQQISPLVKVRLRPSPRAGHHLIEALVEF